VDAQFLGGTQVDRLHDWTRLSAEDLEEPHMILRMSRYPVIDGEDETLASLCLTPIPGS
jgi:hypothetical protein